jgi:hypothetical protein
MKTFRLSYLSFIFLGVLSVSVFLLLSFSVSYIHIRIHTYTHTHGCTYRNILDVLQTHKESQSLKLSLVTFELTLATE